MPRFFTFSAITAGAFLGSVALAQADGLMIPVPAVDVQQTSQDYTCESMGKITVTYINAGPNSLAVVPIDGEPIVFANVLSASGARYAAGSKIWWSSKGGAMLEDVHEGENATPVKCVEAK
ncbi:MAG: MliC family protein [Stappiaceae bacterium]